MWWLEPGWTQACCAQCGAKIWPAGDPDWGFCYDCFSARLPRRQEPQHNPQCDICGLHEAVTGAGGVGVCSQQCADEAGRLAKLEGQAGG